MHAARLVVLSAYHTNRPVLFAAACLHPARQDAGAGNATARHPRAPCRADNALGDGDSLTKRARVQAWRGHNKPAVHGKPLFRIPLPRHQYRSPQTDGRGCLDTEKGASLSLPCSVPARGRQAEPACKAGGTPHPSRRSRAPESVTRTHPISNKMPRCYVTFACVACLLPTSYVRDSTTPSIARPRPAALMPCFSQAAVPRPPAVDLTKRPG